MSFADAVLKLRSELRISQRQLAAELNVSYTSINRWENGKTIPNKMTMLVIRQFCKDRNIEFCYDEGAGA